MRCVVIVEAVDEGRRIRQRTWIYIPRVAPHCAFHRKPGDILRLTRGQIGSERSMHKGSEVVRGSGLQPCYFIISRSLAVRNSEKLFVVGRTEAVYTSYGIG